MLSPALLRCIHAEQPDGRNGQQNEQNGQAFDVDYHHLYASDPAGRCRRHVGVVHDDWASKLEDILSCVYGGDVRYRRCELLFVEVAGENAAGRAVTPFLTFNINSDNNSNPVRIRHDDMMIFFLFIPVKIV